MFVSRTIFSTRPFCALQLPLSLACRDKSPRLATTLPKLGLLNRFGKAFDLNALVSVSAFSLLAALALHFWSHLLIHLHPLYEFDRSFQHASPRLWNQLPASLRQPLTNLSSSDSPGPSSGTSSIGSIDSPLSSSITHSLFPSRLKTFRYSFV